MGAVTHLNGLLGAPFGLQEPSWLVVLAAAIASYTVVLATYRLFLHPLANVPGPKIAALTSWWEVYENVWKGGHLPFELKELHKTYGSLF